LRIKDYIIIRRIIIFIGINIERLNISAINISYYIVVKKLKLFDKIYTIFII